MLSPVGSWWQSSQPSHRHTCARSRSREDKRRRLRGKRTESTSFLSVSLGRGREHGSRCAGLPVLWPLSLAFHKQPSPPGTVGFKRPGTMPNSSPHLHLAQLSAQIRRCSFEACQLGL